MKGRTRGGVRGALELRVPPPLVALTAATLMWWTARLLPGLVREPRPDRLVVALVGLAGVSSALFGVGAVFRARTTIHPHTPHATTKLVRTGIYRLTRNPMYLGLLLVLIAWALHLSHPLVVAWLPLFILYLHHFQIVPEERALGRLFGADFADYKRRVRRWI